MPTTNKRSTKKNKQGLDVSSLLQNKKVQSAALVAAGAALPYLVKGATQQATKYMNKNIKGNRMCDDAERANNQDSKIYQFCHGDYRFLTDMIKIIPDIIYLRVDVAVQLYSMIKKVCPESMVKKFMGNVAGTSCNKIENIYKVLKEYESDFKNQNRTYTDNTRYIEGPDEVKMKNIYINDKNEVVKKDSKIQSYFIKREIHTYEILDWVFSLISATGVENQTFFKNKVSIGGFVGGLFGIDIDAIINKKTMSIGCMDNKGKIVSCILRTTS